MRFILSIFILLLISGKSSSQFSDFIKVKKKNNRTIKTYFPGSAISFKTVYGNYIKGVVYAIHHDSVFVKEYDVRAIPNMWGVSSVDTLATFIIGINYNDIETMAFKKSESFGFVRNGTIFIVGGLAYAALNVFNGKYLKQSLSGPENRKSLAIALGVAGTGLLINRWHKYSNRNGRRYKVEYVKMDTPTGPKAF